MLCWWYCTFSPGMSMSEIYKAVIFDKPFFLIPDDKCYLYVGEKELYEFIGRNYIPKNLPLESREFRSFNIKTNEIHWRCKFISYESVHLVLEKATCCPSKKIILMNGFKYMIEHYIYPKSISHDQKFYEEYVNAAHNFPTNEADVNILYKQSGKNAMDPAASTSKEIAASAIASTSKESPKNLDNEYLEIIRELQKKILNLQRRFEK